MSINIKDKGQLVNNIYRWPSENAKNSSSEKKIEVIDLKSVNKSDSRTSKQVAKKISSYIVRCIAIGILFTISVVFNVATLGIPKIYNYTKIQQLKKKIEIHKLSVLKTALNVKIQGKVFLDWTSKTLIDAIILQYNPKRSDIPLYDKAAWLKTEAEKKKEVTTFVSEAKKIAHAIENGEESGLIRSKIAKLMNSTVYQALKNTNDPTIEFLQILCMKYMGGKEGLKETDLFAEYGAEILGDLGGKTEFSLDEFAHIMDKKIGSSYSFQRNSVISTLVWTIFHPLDFWHIMEGNSDPANFNTHEGNPDLYGYDFVLAEGGKEKRMRFYYGPGPTGDPLYKDGYLVYMNKQRERGIDIYERRANYQNIHQKLEEERIYEMRRYENEYPDVFRLLSLSFDTPLTKNPPSFKNAYDFMSMLKSHFSGEGAHKEMYRDKSLENGIYIGPKVLNDNEVDQALEASSEIFVDLSQDNTYWNDLMDLGKKGEKRLARMMVLGTHAVIGVGSIYKALKEMKNSEAYFDEKLDSDLTASRISGACKQDIDRGIVENIMERIFFRLLTDTTPLTKTEINSMIGAALARAYMVEGRLMQWDRYQLLSDLLHFVGNQENTGKLSEHLQAYVKRIK